MHHNVASVIPEAGPSNRDLVPGASTISIRNLRKAYELPAGEFTALHEMNLEVTAGEFVMVIGRFGSGKTTLLNLLAGIDLPSSGEMTISGERVDTLRGSAMAAWRGTSIGLIFQFFQLLPALSMIEFAQLKLAGNEKWTRPMSSPFPCQP